MKAVKITARSGKQLLTGLGPHPDLSSWWEAARNAGAVIGNAWCLPFDLIGFAELIDIQQDQAQEIGKDRHISHAAATIGAGLWKPLGVA